MHATIALATLAAVAYAAPQGEAVTEDISPEGAPPAGFSESYDSKFQISAVNITSVPVKREVLKRAACPTEEGTLLLTLADGKLTDMLGRTGYIAANYQFQFDGPPQAGAIYTDGFSVGSNFSLALGPSAVFYQCLSGEFYNLYDRHWAPQCNAVTINVLPCGDGAPSGPSQPTGEQPQGPMISQIGDGQLQMPTGTPVTVIGDGQPQAPTGTPVTVIGDGQPQAPTGTPVTVIGDGQPQAPTGTPVTVIGDGQPQAPTGTPVTVIGDGQPQAPTGTPVTVIGDGQPQAPTGTPVTVIGDGQPQAPTFSAPIGEISAPSSVTPAIPIFTGAANTVMAGSSFMAIIGGLFAFLL